jgi:hypothetical protein
MFALRELAAVARRFDDFVRELARFNDTFRVPGAAQRETVRCRTGTAKSRIRKDPGSAAQHCMLRCVLRRLQDPRQPRHLAVHQCGERVRAAAPALMPDEKKARREPGF